MGFVMQGEVIVGGLELGDGHEADGGLRGFGRGLDAGEDAGDVGGELFCASRIHSHLRVWSKLAFCHGPRCEVPSIICCLLPWG